MNENLYYRFSQHFPDGDSTLLRAENGDQVSYSNLENESARYARLLSDLGAVPGDRITVQIEKSIEALWLYLACLRGGFVFHPLNTAYQINELSYFVENAEPRIIICDPQFEQIMKQLGEGVDVIKVLTLDQMGCGTLIELLKSTSANFDTHISTKEDTAALLYSSGTTGVPKGIVLSHGNLSSNAETLVSAWDFTQKDCLLHALQIFHVHGLFVGIGCVLMSGAKMHWLNGFNVKEVLKGLPLCSVMMGVPTFYTRLLASDGFDRDLCRQTRLFISGSAPLLEDTFKAFEKVTSHRILERYGMTETNMLTSNPLNGERLPGSVGHPLPGVQLRIVDESGTELNVGEIGAVQVKGPNVFKGYWRLPEKTKEDFTDDDFFNTGDQGQFNDQGYLAIVGREKDMVISGGLNIYPREIELLIDDLDGVRESAVIGVPHKDFGEGLVAVVVEKKPGKLNQEDVLNWVKCNLANYKVPKAIIFVDELPRNTMGKVQKKNLRERYGELLNNHI